MAVVFLAGSDMVYLVKNEPLSLSIEKYFEHQKFLHLTNLFSQHIVPSETLRIDP